MVHINNINLNSVFTLIIQTDRSEQIVLTLIKLLRDYTFFSSIAKFIIVFVCVEVLRPSQPNGVMSSMVSLPNHTFTVQA